MALVDLTTALCSGSSSDGGEDELVCTPLATLLPGAAAAKAQAAAAEEALASSPAAPPAASPAAAAAAGGHTYLSIDVGVRNLALCLVTFRRAGAYARAPWVPDLRRWQLLDVLGAARAPAALLLDAAAAALDGALPAGELLPAGADVLIEEQPFCRDPSGFMRGSVEMKSLSAGLYMYFKLRHPQHRVRFATPRGKLRVQAEAFGAAPFAPPPQLAALSAYRRRKQTATALATHICAAHDHAQAAFLASHRKRDDLADCFLQAAAVLSADEALQGKRGRKRAASYE